MADSNDIQLQINSVQADQNKWSAELMRLNGVLATAKGGVKNRTQRAIKNAEQYINDLSKRLKNLDGDLSKAMRIEVKEKDNILLAEKGIDQKGNIIKGISDSATSITESIMGGSSNPIAIDSKRNASAEGGVTPEGMKSSTMILIGVGALVLIFMLKKK